MIKAEESQFSISRSHLDFEVLPEPLQEMLAEAVDEYVIAIEEGRRPDRTAFVSRFPPVETHLNAYLDQIEWLHHQSDSRSDSLNALTEESKEGLRYDDFEIGPELGRGAMGIVYQAFQRSLQRWVAIKVLPYGPLLDEQRTQRFWREARIAGALEHPGIVTVYGFGQHKDVCFYAMTLVEGRSLDRHIRDAEASRRNVDSGDEQQLSGSSSPLEGSDRYRRIAKLVAEAADAIHAAHLAGVVHRDIKPSNLIVDSQGRVKVTDFGLAIDTADLGLTRSGEVVGTLRYMSPEQAAGKRGLVDHRSDIYCLGATLYELLTLKPPFDSESLAEIVRLKEAGTLILPRTIDAKIPKALQTITLKAMRADSVERYQSANQLAQDLRCFLDGRPISAVDVSLFEKANCWARRNIGIVLTSVCCLVILFAVAVAFNIAQKSQQVALEKALIDREKNFQKARTAVDQLGIQFAERLELIPEATELRRDLLQTSLNYYSDFLSESKNDDQVTQAIAEARWKMAQATAGLATLEEAERLYSDADKELASLVPEHPELLSVRAEMLSDWATRHMGRYLGEASNPTTALSILGRISSDDRRLSPTHRALLKNNRAFILTTLLRPDEAIRFAREAVDVLQHDTSDKSEHAIARSLCVSMLNLSQALENAGQADASLDVARQCLAYVAGMTPDDSAEQVYLNQLRAKSMATLANLQWKHKGADAALEGLQSVVDIHTEQLSACPGSIDLRWDLAVALNNLGMALSSAGDKDPGLRGAARNAFEKAYSIAEAETQANAKDALAAHRAANIQNNLGLLLKKMDLMPESRECLRSAARHASRASSLEPENAAIAESLDRIQRNMSSPENSQ